LANTEPISDGLIGEANGIRGVEASQGPSVAGTQLTRFKRFLYRIRKRENPKKVGDRAPILTYSVSNLLVSE